MSLIRSVAVLLLIMLAAACTPERAPEATVEPVTETPPPDPEPEPEPEPPADPLYEDTAADMRVAFADGLFSLYQKTYEPSQARRVDGGAVAGWLGNLEEHDPVAAAFARRTLGPVLQQAYVVGFVMPNAVAESCVSFKDALYIPVPERYQKAELNTDGIIVKATCASGQATLALHCVGGRGTAPDGTSCSCVCSIGEAPGSDCISC